jgi:NAD(P)H-dependent FMN reductase
MKLIAFAASTSRNSINKTLVTYAASLVEGADVEVLDLNDYELPLFSEDKEKELGQPEAAKRFFEKLGTADAIIVSFAEHNGNYTAAYKNLFDWTSRIEQKFFQNKPMVLLSTSPGGRGGQTVLELAANSVPRFAGDVRASLSIPSFHDNFDSDKSELTNPELQKLLAQATQLLA